MKTPGTPLRQRADAATVDRLFIARRARMLARASRMNLVYIAIGILAFALWDWWRDPAYALGSTLVRVAGAALILALLPLLRSGLVQDMQVRYVYGGAFLIATLTVGIAVLQLRDGVLYGTAGIVVFPAILAFYSIPIRFYYQCIVLALALLVPLMWWGGTDHGVLLNFVLYYGLLSWVGATAARMLRRQQLRAFRLELSHAEEARTDPLTGLFNRRLILELGAREVELARRTGHMLTVGLIDVDHFKLVNDRLGHDAGDSVLKAIADALTTTLRQSDALARFGGEEFVVILPGSDLQEAGHAAQRMLDQVRALHLPQWPGLTLSISIGLAELGRNGDSWDAVLRAADLALLMAKQAGRDRWIAAG